MLPYSLERSRNYDSSRCVIRRALPNKRGMGAAFALLGSTFTGLMRYWFGRWIPTFEQLMYSKVSLPYLQFSSFENSKANFMKIYSHLILQNSMPSNWILL